MAMRVSPENAMPCNAAAPIGLMVVKGLRCGVTDEAELEIITYSR
jgi:hypothetical protein